MGPIPDRRVSDDVECTERWIAPHTFVEARVSFLPDNTTECIVYTLLPVVGRGYVHLALEGDVGICDGGGEELAEGAEKEGHDGRDPTLLLLNYILHLLEEGVLKNRVDDENESRDDTGEQGLGPLVFEKGHEGADGAGGPDGLGHFAGLDIVSLDLLPRGHAGVDDPDGVGDEDGGGSGDGSGDHGLDRGELLGRAARGDGALLEEGLGPLIPVIVDEVGDADAE